MRPTHCLLLLTLAIACDSSSSSSPATTTETKTAKASETKKAPEAKAPEAKAVEAKAVEAKTVEAKVEETKVAEPATPPAPAKPSIPATRPKTLTEARDHLVAIAANDQLGELAKLVDGTKLETTYQHESKGKKKKSSLSTADAAKLAAEFRGEPWKPIHYVSALPDDYNATLSERLALDEAASTIRYEPDGAFTVTFRFAKKGEELVLVGIDTYDEEP